MPPMGLHGSSALSEIAESLLRADTAPTGDTRQVPLTCPLATFAVATRDDPYLDSIRLRKDAVIV